MVSVKIHKPSISFLKSNKIYEKEKIIHHYLFTKYSKFEFSYSLVCVNNLVFNEQCRAVARFKDFLILDDMTEFLRRFYIKKELKRRLNKIFNFYESYSKIFPNYMILPESKYLYRNIRKKQKMIDAFNQIKKEEEENRNSLKKENKNKEKGEMIVFNKSIQESINRYHPSGTSFLFNSIISGFMKNNNNNESNWNSLISISLNKALPLNKKLLNSNNNSKQNSFECDNNEITLNSENSLINIIQILNKKYDNNMAINNPHNNRLEEYNNKNNYKKTSKNKIINNFNDKIKKVKSQIKKDTKIRKIIRQNNTNDNNIKSEKDKINIDNISTPPKTSSPGHNQLVKLHNHQKSALNNNKKFISHKQAVSVSNNNNTIKIINNINNIIINDPNNNKDMVININTNYFELNNSHINSINTFNKINDNSKEKIHKNLKNSLIKKAKKNSKSKSKETSLHNKKKVIHFPKKLSTNFKTHNNIINNTIEEKRINAYSNNIINSINFDNNLINNHIINIHNNKTNQTINTAKPTIKSRIKKQNNENKIIKGISEYRALNINNIKNVGNLYNNKLKNNYIGKDRNKKAATINIDSIEKIKKSRSKKKKNLEITIGTDGKKYLNNPIFNSKTHNRRGLEILNTDGNINYDINTYNTYFNSNEQNNNGNLGHSKMHSYIHSIKNDQIKYKLNKNIIMARKQKTNSLQINNKNNFFSSFNNNKITKELNSLKRNNITNNGNYINEIKNYTQSNIDSENTKTKKFLNQKEDVKFKKISAKEMKEKYHKFMQGNKFIHGSYDTSNRLHLFKKFSSLYNSHNTQNTNNITEISQRKILNIKSPFKINNKINTPGSKISSKNVSNNINSKTILESNYKTNDKNLYKNKIQTYKKEGTQEKNKYFIYKINGLKNKIFISDANNKKMKFVKK